MLIASNMRIWSIDKGWVRAWAGDGKAPANEDGPRLDAGFLFPEDLAADGQGRVYVAESAGGLRLIENGLVKTLLTKSPINKARGVAVDGKGRVYVAD